MYKQHSLIALYLLLLQPNFFFLFFFSSKPEISRHADQTRGKKSYCSYFRNALASLITSIRAVWWHTSIFSHPNTLMVCLAVTRITGQYAFTEVTRNPILAHAAISHKSRCDTAAQQHSNQACQQHNQYFFHVLPLIPFMNISV